MLLTYDHIFYGLVGLASRLFHRAILEEVNVVDALTMTGLEMAIGESATFAGYSYIYAHGAGSFENISVRGNKLDDLPGYAMVSDQVIEIVAMEEGADTVSLEGMAGRIYLKISIAQPVSMNLMEVVNIGGLPPAEYNGQPITAHSIVFDNDVASYLRYYYGAHYEAYIGGMPLDVEPPPGQALLTPLQYGGPSNYGFREWLEMMYGHTRQPADPMAVVHMLLDVASIALSIAAIPLSGGSSLFWPIVFMGASAALDGVNAYLYFAEGDYLYGILYSGMAVMKVVVTVRMVGAQVQLTRALGIRSMGGTVDEAIMGGVCFAGDTLVPTRHGYKEIKDIAVGDEVLSEDPRTGERGFKRVADVFEREAAQLVRVLANGEEIVATESHPFWVEGRGWVAVGRLQAGDILRSSTGRGAMVEGVASEGIDSPPARVYNFEVEDWHTYYVSAAEALVHNSCSQNDSIKHIYQNLRSAPQYPEGFIPHGGPRTTPMNDTPLLEQLQECVPGMWKKVFFNGYDMYGEQISVHYFKHEVTNQVFNVKVMQDWSYW